MFVGILVPLPLTNISFILDFFKIHFKELYIR
uniref:Uncharacterized protein n=1 Tax=Rhizophora mucronata TaxID=61149 RepID=A0A2P2PZS2_RHIMU